MDPAIDAAASGEARRASSRRRLATLGLAAAPVGFLALFFLIPVLMVAAYSVGMLTLLPQD
ncbi:MAG TPA: hypothetical protein VJ259_05620, partial [Actinomycetota bacterium]|nr:hypothetical protein [Actinomycetota bacterium]